MVGKLASREMEMGHSVLGSGGIWSNNTSSVSSYCEKIYTAELGISAWGSLAQLSCRTLGSIASRSIGTCSTGPRVVLRCLRRSTLGYPSLRLCLVLLPLTVETWKELNTENQDSLQPLDVILVRAQVLVT